ncbi:MAG: PAN/Apple domain-containing protein, partial [Pseudomonadota bacterium]
EFMDRCGDACRPYLGRLIPLRNTVRQYATRCRAASSVARNRMRGGRFAPLKTFSDLCAKAVDVSRCVASRDATSQGCLCVVDPRGEGCGIDPDAVCAAGLADAAAAARQSSSLAPLETYATAAADCLANPTHNDALSAARVAVCQSADVDRDRGPIPPGLAGCRWAEVLREKLARQSACADAFDRVLRARNDHAALADFLSANAACREVDAAMDLMRGRVDAAVENAALAVDAPARREAARALGDMSAAFAPYLTPSDLDRLEAAARTVARAPCFEAFEDARLGGEPALAAFVRERTDCGPSVDNARALMVELRCEADYGAVDTNDARDLFRFALSRSECRVEAGRAQRQVDRLGLDCLSAAERSGGSDRESLAKIIAAVETCQIGFSAISERFSAHASARLKALRAMEQTLATPPLAPPSQSGWRGPSGAAQSTPPEVTPPATASTYVALFNTVDFFGSDIVRGGFKVRNETECAQRCFDNGRCRYFTYNTRARHCFIKSGYGHITSHPDALSGMFYNSVDGRGAPSLTVGGRNQILYNQDFRGNDIMSATLNGVSLDACQAACDRNTQCAAFSYIERARQCWQKYAAGRPRRKSGVHSGRSRQGSGRTLSPSRVMAVD